MTVDLATLPGPLADAVRSARERRRGFAPTPLAPREKDPVLKAWAREVTESGALDAAIADVAVADPDLRS